jgi:hypothetical protein
MALTSEKNGGEMSSRLAGGKLIDWAMGAIERDDVRSKGVLPKDYAADAVACLFSRRSSVEAHGGLLVDTTFFRLAA